MDWKKSSASQSVGNYEGFEQLVERGRQMHNQAVFELFASLVSNVIPLLKKDNGMTFKKPNSGNYNRGLSIKYSS